LQSLFGVGAAIGPILRVAVSSQVGQPTWLCHQRQSSRQAAVLSSECVPPSLPQRLRGFCEMACWARVVVAAPDGTQKMTLLTGEGAPDLAVVEELARCQLMARRAGGVMWLEEVSLPLAELLDLVGLRQEMDGQGRPTATDE